MDSKKGFRCFSRNLKEYLEDNGEECVVKAINPTDGRTMWVFIRSKSLDRLLNNWSNKRPTNRE